MRSPWTRRHVSLIAGLAAAVVAGCSPELPREAGSSGTAEGVHSEEMGIEITGSVADARLGEAVGGAVIFPVADLEGTVAGALPAGRPQAKTGRDGGFRFEVAANSWAALECRAAGFAVARHPLHKDGAERMHVTFALQPGGAIAGRVLHAGTGAPVPGVALRARPLDSTGERSGALVFRAESGDDGGFEIAGMPQGGYEVELLAREAGLRIMGPVRREVEVSAEREPAAVEYRVYEGAAVRGTVVGMTSEPVAGAQVRLLPGSRTTTEAAAAGSETTQASAQGNTTDGDGRFVVAGLAYDTPYRLYASAEDHAPAVSGVFRLTPGAATPNIALVLLPGSIVEGHIGFSRYRPAPDVVLRLEPLPGTPIHGLPPQESKADAEGAFGFPHVAPGLYRVTPLREDGTPLEEDAVELHVDGVSDAEHQTLRISLREWQGNGEDRPKAVLEGVVLDPVGEPAGGVTVEVRDHATGEVLRVAKADEAGRFRAKGMVVDAYALTVDSDVGTATMAAAAPGQEITLRLAPPIRVEGVVRMPGGEAAPGAKVELVPQRLEEPVTPETVLRMALFRESPTSTEADAEGRFVFVNVRPGAYVAQASVETALKGASSPFVVGDGEAPLPPLVVDLHVELGIEGRVEDSSGEPVRGAVVRLQPWPRDAFGAFLDTIMPLEIQDSAARARTGRKGTFRLEGLAPGDYRIAVTHPDYALLWRGPVKVAGAGAQPQERFTLLEGGRVEGVAVAGAIPRENVTVQLLGEKELRSAVTDAEGVFSVEHIAPGEYLVNEVNPKHREAARAFQAFAMTPRVVVVDEGATVSLRLDADAGAVVRGIVKGAGLDELVLVSLRLPDGPAPDEIDPMQVSEVINAARFIVGQSLAGPDGSFVLRRIPPETYTLDVVSIALDAREPDLRAMLEADRTPRLQIPVTVGEEPVELNLNVEPVRRPAPPA